MARPKKDPAKKLVRVNLTLRRQDLEILQRLAIERFVVVVDHFGPDFQKTDEAIRANLDQRPSMSYAIRWLIDAERERRLKLARTLRERAKQGPAPDDALLRRDMVFGAPIRGAKLLLRELGDEETAATVRGSQSIGDTKGRPRRRGRPPS